MLIEAVKKARWQAAQRIQLGETHVRLDTKLRHFMANDIRLRGKLVYEREDMLWSVKMLERGMFPNGKNLVDLMAWRTGNRPSTQQLSTLAWASWWSSHHKPESSSCERYFFEICQIVLLSLNPF